jgi:hypothetical protein
MAESVHRSAFAASRLGGSTGSSAPGSPLFGLGLPCDADAWLAQKRREMDFKLKELAYRARADKLPGVRLVDGVLVVSPQLSALHAAILADATNLGPRRMAEASDGVS